MSVSQPVTAALPQSSFAGLGSRLLAYLLDGLITLCVLLMASLTLRGFRAIGVWTVALGLSPVDMWRGLGISAKLAIVVASVIATGPIYFVLFEASAWQATLGKRLLKIYVADGEGRRISDARASWRWLAKWFLGWCLFGLLTVASMAMIATTPEKKALHDFAAKTVVLRGEPLAGGSLERWRIVAAFGIPFLWILVTFMQLGDV